MASIQIFNNFHCAGSIIKSDLIVTASSCLQLAWNNRFFRENPAFLSARVGSSFYSGGGEVIPVLEIYFHPGYNPKNLRNNICVLRLMRHLNFRKRDKRIKKIDFDRFSSDLPVTTPDITILGWGAKGYSSVIDNPWKNILSFSVIDVYPLEDCQDVYSREYVTRKNFCAGYLSKGGGACNRDVGGPGIADGKLMGVISFGSPVCGAPDAPTVFTKLGYYSDWIEEIMEMDIPVSKKKTTSKPYSLPWTTQYTTRTKPTTFNIPPFTEKNMSPKPISFIDNQLRILDEQVFKDFLATMFHSEEINKNENLKHVKEEKAEFRSTANQGTPYYEEVTEKIKPVTDFEDVSLEDRYTNTAVTIVNKEIKNQPVYDVDDEIEKLIKNVNLEQIIKEEVKVTPRFAKDLAKLDTPHKSKNDSVETLLYLSDDDKDYNANNIPLDDVINDEREEIYDGMSIPVSGFQDFTRTKDKESESPESDLLGLLTETIGRVIGSTKRI
ncbi:uncharacterized protein LOC112043187 [Bicyclus anynana]|uniref:Uncharacterized protein LOC112043187 n=1 Tax=Bicyclus anynana TaxID=110368 RepID=A0A6J1MGH0_BICAN|nr:uncharacterized protein LOC112043187 [Bicyclus anynana]